MHNIKITAKQINPRQSYNDLKTKNLGPSAIFGLTGSGLLQFSDHHIQGLIKHQPIKWQHSQANWRISKICFSQEVNRTAPSLFPRTSDMGTPSLPTRPVSRLWWSSFVVMAGVRDSVLLWWSTRGPWGGGQIKGHSPSPLPRLHMRWFYPTTIYHTCIKTQVNGRRVHTVAQSIQWHKKPPLSFRLSHRRLRVHKRPASPTMQYYVSLSQCVCPCKNWRRKIYTSRFWTVFFLFVVVIRNFFHVD